MRETFSIEVSNRFHPLSHLPIDALDEYCKDVQEAFTATSKEMLGCKLNTMKPWICRHTWELIEKMKALKQNLLASKGNNVAHAAEKYKAKNKEVKTSAKQSSWKTKPQRLKQQLQRETHKPFTRTYQPRFWQNLSCQGQKKTERLSREKIISELVGQNILKRFLTDLAQNSWRT
ncbi:hypothetical protein ElyMa_001021900 [Elysia marginata]|uniref:Uncharacterized protein n=1 Tax=Elysia marginata TaxID=1093978 RepID=A0AAV4HMJ1_9GAST|nr:hypothetical protein ElyMa_001021900 [Elysia marginata]